MNKVVYQSEFKDGFAQIQKFNGRWGFVNKEGKEIGFEASGGYISVYDFQNGFAAVQKSDKIRGS